MKLINKKSLLTLLLTLFVVFPATAWATSSDSCFCYYDETAEDGTEIAFCLPLSTWESIDLANDAECVSGCQSHTNEKHDSVTHLVPNDLDAEAGRVECARVTEEGDQRVAELAAAGTVTETETPTPIPPIIPKLNVQIPGFTEDFFEVVEDGNYLNVNFLGEYVVAWYRWLIGSATIIATVMIMVGGVQYMLGKGMGQIDSAKKRIQSAVIGLVLLLGSYVILYTVNPQLTFFEPLRVQYVAYVALPLEEQADLAYDPNLGKLCDSIANCREWCALTVNGTDEAALEAEVPTKATAGMASPDDLEPISGISGLETNGDHMLLPEAMDMLKNAATIAKSKGITLYVVSSYRPLLQQLKLACDEIVAADNATRSPKIPSKVAWPGSSAHGVGTAVDIKYYTGTPDNLSWNVEYDTQDTAPPENVALLAETMYAAGWSRYIKEIWHFQAYSGNCTSQSCKVAESSCTCN